MINASDKTEPAGPSPPRSPPLSPYRARYFLDFCFRSNSDTPSPEVTGVSEFMSLAAAPRFAKMTVSSRDIGIEK